ncbi:MAG TPA: VOC family protein [Trebonia sp.]|nr:VOC family protein [Trebonia sp.]
MSLSVNAIAVITLFAQDEDFAAASSFYQEVLGAAVLDVESNATIFKLANMMINFVPASHAGDFIGPTATVAPGDPARSVLPLGVDDVDAACAELARHGVRPLHGPVNQPWGVRTATFTDPAGHIWEVVADMG